jgi:cold-inducible RNA-binding protein
LGALRRGGLVMGTKLYIGNLSQTARETDLETLFHRAGVVMSVAIPTDVKTGYRKNYGFVNMGTEDGAKAAIQVLNGSMLCSSQISVREATSKE